jgi:hypothetical protein
MTKRKPQQEEAQGGITVTQLACRVPKELYRVVRVFCVSNETSVADFVAEAMRHELERRRSEGRARRPAAEPTAPAPARKKKRVRETRVWDYPVDDDENAA